MATCNYAGMPVSLEDAMTLLNGATMHNLTNLRDGGLVTFVALPSCHLCRLGYGPNSEFPVDGKRCGGCRAVYYCNKVGVVVYLCALGAFQPTFHKRHSTYVRYVGMPDQRLARTQEDMQVAQKTTSIRKGGAKGIPNRRPRFNSRRTRTRGNMDENQR
jgi:hypothetical protein